MGSTATTGVTVTDRGVNIDSAGSTVALGPLGWGACSGIYLFFCKIVSSNLKNYSINEYCLTFWGVFLLYTDYAMVIAE